MAFAQLMNSTQGRLLRIIVGGVMIFAGLGLIGGWLGVLVAALGVIPLAAGTFDVCLLAPILSVPWSGSTIRSMK